MLAEPHHRFSVEEYYRMADSGVLKPDARVELLDGKVIDISPISPLHGGLVNRLIRLFSKRFDGPWLVVIQNHLHLNEHSEPQPDFMLLKPAADDYMTRHPLPEDVLLLIEVSDSSLKVDRELKLPLYGRAGIAEFWILNLAENALEIYREPHFTGYGASRKLTAGNQASLLAFPGVVVDVAELLKQA